MNTTEKIAIAVQKMYGKNTPWCHSLGALHLIAVNECEQSPERDAIITHLEKMHEQIKQLCGSYDKLRSLTGALELVAGVEPTFYVSPDAGNTNKSFCPIL